MFLIHDGFKSLFLMNIGIIELSCNRYVDNPQKGNPFLHKAMFTVNSPLRFINSLVPSRGSTIQQYSQFFRVL